MARKRPAAAEPPDDSERVTVWLMSTGHEPRPVTVRGTWRTFWTSEAFAQAVNEGAGRYELDRCYGIYKNQPKRKKEK